MLSPGHTDRPLYLRHGPPALRGQQAGYRLPQVLPPPPPPLLLCDSSPETFPTVSSRGRCEMDNEAARRSRPESRCGAAAAPANGRAFAQKRAGGYMKGRRPPTADIQL